MAGDRPLLMARDRPRQPPERRDAPGAQSRLADRAQLFAGGVRRRLRLRVDRRMVSRRRATSTTGSSASRTRDARAQARARRGQRRAGRAARSPTSASGPRSRSWCAATTARGRSATRSRAGAGSTTRTTRSSSSTTARRTRRRTSRASSACRSSARRTGARAPRATSAWPRRPARSWPTLDDDAYPDPHWLTYLATAFMTTDHAGVGGPNIPPPGRRSRRRLRGERAGGARPRPALGPTSPSTSRAATWRSARTA